MNLHLFQEPAITYGKEIFYNAYSRTLLNMLSNLFMKTTRNNTENYQSKQKSEEFLYQFDFALDKNKIAEMRLFGEPEDVIAYHVSYYFVQELNSDEFHQFLLNVSMSLRKEPRLNFQVVFGNYSTYWENKDYGYNQMFMVQILRPLLNVFSDFEEYWGNWLGHQENKSRIFTEIRNWLKADWLIEASKHHDKSMPVFIVISKDD